jgi:hypothetical protein
MGAISKSMGEERKIRKRRKRRKKEKVKKSIWAFDFLTH